MRRRALLFRLRQTTRSQSGYTRAVQRARRCDYELECLGSRTLWRHRRSSPERRVRPPETLCASGCGRRQGRPTLGAAPRCRVCSGQPPVPCKPGADISSPGQTHCGPVGEDEMAPVPKGEQHRALNAALEGLVIFDNRTPVVFPLACYAFLTADFPSLTCQCWPCSCLTYERNGFIFASRCYTLSHKKW